MVDRRDIIRIDRIEDEIASRRLVFNPGDGEVEIVVRIGKPKQFSNYVSYFCPFEITGFGKPRYGLAGGVDAIQSLQLVMVMIGGLLEFLKDKYGGRLTWEGDSEGGLGFPLEVHTT